MEVCIGAVAVLLVRDRHVVVDDDVHALDINTAADEVGGDEDALLSLLELLVLVDTAQGKSDERRSGGASGEASAKHNRRAHLSLSL